MENPVETIDARLSAIEKEQNAILSKSGQYMVDSDQVQYDALGVEADNLKRVRGSMAGLSRGRQTVPDQIPDQRGTIRVPATIAPKSRVFGDARRARNFALWARACAGDRRSEALLSREGINIGAAMLEGVNQSGGFFVPEVFWPEVIKLIEERGVFRRETRVIPISREKVDIPRRDAGVTGYYIGEAENITASDMTIGLVSLVLKKVGAITVISNELNSDSLVSIGDLIAEDMAYQIANAEDQAGFNGDGSSTYGGIVGIRQQLIQKALGGTASGSVPAGSGLVRYGTGHAYTNIAITNLTSMVGKLPSYATSNAKWFMSRLVWSYIIDLLADAGGNTLQSLQAGPNGLMLLGYPVVLSDVMPQASAVNQVCALFGDLRLGATMAVHTEGVRIEASNSATVGSTNTFTSDQFAIRAVSRYDINVHDVGSTTTCGPVVGLIAHTA